VGFVGLGLLAQRFSGSVEPADGGLLCWLVREWREILLGWDWAKQGDVAIAVSIMRNKSLLESSIPF